MRRGERVGRDRRTETKDGEREGREGGTAMGDERREMVGQ